ncbi:FGGY carbohydrate kinase domain-containing protein-like isoform X2 [Amphibalanus amphitrite]|nr:FGGY carbohydrate kinase domain-containing protein-like isoform X2 [Amphibalanus amphitrite]XP_043224039.1 FGGY carbohydrate kinase domain-containing protein-like isoform X2 [Amphibalanus amphitrite]XP_043224040.1 FGGY carbohydrate kinase domain-containing protein-like isoform X2 [Amphibalanus amphitrite]XP_043224042.1 FGGY carbohydrate kinase domain-containing protein-like isoform X2 [Amphibalanus amphitrite]XP_043224043.1 FGGY carbohydrate kinase domain-containing protein-like isoform X2 [
MGVFVGVDVGTGSVRAAVFEADGRLLASHSLPIATWSPQPDLYQQDSEAIWNACCTSVKTALSESGADPATVLGIGFDATCSLVVLDTDLRPLTVSPQGEPDQNIIVWMDHRAVEEAKLINSLGHPVLKSVGGTISPEMQTPKLLWLQQHMPDTWHRAGMFFDLPDFLTWKATGSLTRSLCTVVCKWTYQAGDKETEGWDRTYFEQIGLGGLAEEGWKRIGTEVAAPGSPLGEGVTEEAAERLGVPAGTPVGAALIDAHAGGLGLMAIRDQFEDPCTRLGIIAGTSSCFMAVSREPCPVSGVWGPYWSAMLPGLWLSEGGQSASGRLLEYVINSHPLGQAATENNRPVQEDLEELLSTMAKDRGLSDVTLLTSDLHVYPDHHGNRSPHADTTLRGMVSGLTLDTGRQSLAKYYLAHLQAICYGSRSIVEALSSGGHRIEAVYICGGIAKSSLFVQTLADVLGVPVTCPSQPEAVLLGAAMLGAVASGLTLDDVRGQISGAGTSVSPRPELEMFHLKKYKVFQKMHRDQLTYKEIMEGSMK